MAINTLTSDDPALPTDYPGFIFRTLRKEGHPADALLEGTGLTEALLADPNFRFAFWSLRRLVLNALDLSGDPHLGIRLAQQFEASYMGLPAYAAMNAASFKEALGILSRFLFLTFPTIEFAVVEAGAGLRPGEMAIRLRPRLALGEIAYFVSSSTLVACHGLFEALLRTTRVAIRGEMMVAMPSGWAEISAKIGFPIQFEANENRLVFPGELFDAPLPGADPINHARLLALCEQFATDVGHEATVASKVTAFLEADGNLAASLTEAAASLGYSERSLRRQLAHSGTTYRKLAEQISEGRARKLLGDTARPIQAIAFDLGFDSPSNFARSFKRWTGTSPKAFRSRHKGSPGAGQD